MTEVKKWMIMQEISFINFRFYLLTNRERHPHTVASAGNKHKISDVRQFSVDSKYVPLKLQWALRQGFKRLRNFDFIAKIEKEQFIIGQAACRRQGFRRETENRMNSACTTRMIECNIQQLQQLNVVEHEHVAAAAAFIDQLWHFFVLHGHTSMVAKHPVNNTLGGQIV